MSSASPARASLVRTAPTATSNYRTAHASGASAGPYQAVTAGPNRVTEPDRAVGRRAMRNEVSLRLSEAPLRTPTSCAAAKSARTGTLCRCGLRRRHSQSAQNFRMVIPSLSGGGGPVAALPVSALGRSPCRGQLQPPAPGRQSDRRRVPPVPRWGTAQRHTTRPGCLCRSRAALSFGPLSQPGCAPASDSIGANDRGPPT